jgi:hypothetical protein
MFPASVLVAMLGDLAGDELTRVANGNAIA